MSEVVERVARAMWAHRQRWALSNGLALDDWGDGTVPNANGIMDEAKDAVSAMRICTPEMLEAGCMAHPEGDYHAGTTLGDIIRAEWEAMCDEALK
jgi:hypothetical protein